jgi:hypothetical protein
MARQGHTKYGSRYWSPVDGEKRFRAPKEKRERETKFIKEGLGTGN